MSEPFPASASREHLGRDARLRTNSLLQVRYLDHDERIDWINFHRDNAV